MDARHARFEPLPLPILTALLEAVDLLRLGRPVALRTLLDESLDAYAADGAREAGEVRRLYFAEDGQAPGAASPSDLLAAARSESGLDEAAFRALQHRRLSGFAGFLADWCDERVGRAGASARAAAPHRTLRKPALVALAAALLLTGALVLALGWPGGPDRRDPGRGALVDRADPGATLTFDDLGGTSSSIIDVYPGVTAAAADRTKNGTYASGQSVRALCAMTGRLVRSDTSSGEAARSSRVWVGIESSTGAARFATLTYARINGRALRNLPAC